MEKKQRKPISEETRLARNAYQREYRRKLAKERPEVHRELMEHRREYLRRKRQENPEWQKEANLRAAISLARRNGYNVTKGSEGNELSRTQKLP